MTRSLPSILVGILMLGTTQVVVEGQEVYSDNVVIVLDGSGSMKEPMRSGGMAKMAAAKQALHAVLSQLPGTTQVGLLVFSASTRKDWLYPLGPQDAKRLEAAIDSIRPGGGTPLGEYIKKGADRLLQQRAKQFGYGSYRLLIVTDGEAQDERLVDRHAGEVMARGITIDVIGVRMKTDHPLATKVHSYRRANDPASLTQAIADVMAEVSGTDTSDAAGENAFGVLAAVPPEIAQAMVQSLATSGNHPIGEAPRAEHGAGEGGRKGAPPPAANGGRAPSPQVDSGSTGIGILLAAAAVVSLIVLALVVRRLKGSV